MGPEPGWLWLMVLVPTAVLLSAVGLEFLEKLLVPGRAQTEAREPSTYA